MIRVNISENFPVTVALLDENTGSLSSGETVNYDVRDLNDSPLSPPISGTLTESSIEAGIYRASINIPTSGNYICYASANGFGGKRGSLPPISTDTMFCGFSSIISKTSIASS